MKPDNEIAIADAAEAFGSAPAGGLHPLDSLIENAFAVGAAALESDEGKELSARYRAGRLDRTAFAKALLELADELAKK